ncbi:MAG: hypothetical protein U1F77_13675 [Kiritimatiellia bacterium]
MTIGYNSPATSATKLTVSGAGTFSIGAPGAPTNANVQIGNGQTTNVGNGATVDFSGLGTFYANLGTWTFRVGDPSNPGGASTVGSTLILAADNTIMATTLTTDSPSGITQAIKLGGGSNVFNANTINLGLASHRASGTLDFSSGAGTFQVRDLAGTGRAAMTISYGGSTTGYAPTSTVNLAGHSSNLLLSTLNIAGRTGTNGGNSFGSFTFDTGVMDVTGVLIGDRRNTVTNSGTSTGTMTLNGGTITIGAGGLTLGSNVASMAGSVSTGIVNLGGTAVATVGATGGTSITLGKSTTAGIVANGTLNITGTGSLTVSGHIIEGAGAGTPASRPPSI